jgi:endonuclease III
MSNTIPDTTPTPGAAAAAAAAPGAGAAGAAAAAAAGTDNAVSAEAPYKRRRRTRSAVKQEQNDLNIALHASSSSSSSSSSSISQATTTPAIARLRRVTTAKAKRESKSSSAGVGVGVGALPQIKNISRSKHTKSESRSDIVFNAGAAAAAGCTDKTMYTHFTELDIEDLDRQFVMEKHQPQHWMNVYKAIYEMRLGTTAAVDTMGCESLGLSAKDATTFRFRTLIALMLSSQTKDETTASAINRLNAFWSDGLTLTNVLATEQSQINELIRQVGFHNRKAEYIKRTCVILRDEYDGDIPPTIETLVKLPGVGPKMAFIAMRVAWKQVVGVGVDVHVHRISNRLKWVKSKNPEGTRAQLESWVPKPLWGTINNLLVGFGQTYCNARAPKCLECKASPYCPIGRKENRYADMRNKPKNKSPKNKHSSKMTAKAESTSHSSNTVSSAMPKLEVVPDIEDTAAANESSLTRKRRRHSTRQHP